MNIKKLLDLKIQLQNMELSRENKKTEARRLNKEVKALSIRINSEYKLLLNLIK